MQRKDLRSSTFSDLRKKYKGMVVNTLMHVPIGRRASQAKVKGFPDLRLGVGEWWVHNSATLSLYRQLKCFQTSRNLKQSTEKECVYEIDPQKYRLLFEHSLFAYKTTERNNNENGNEF